MRNLLPSKFVVLNNTLLVNPARSQLFKQSDHARTARPAINPYRQRRVLRLAISGFEEPPEDRLLGFDVHIARERLDARRKLADAFRDFFVAHGKVVVAFCFGEVCGRRNKLRVCEREAENRG